MFLQSYGCSARKKLKLAAAKMCLPGSKQKVRCRLEQQHTAQPGKRRQLSERQRHKHSERKDESEDGPNSD